MSDEPASSSPSSATTGSLAQNADNEKRRSKKRDQNDRFRFGNYNRYYGVRNKGFEHDPRLELFPPDWFLGRHVLDIGCNAGHLTLEIAKRLNPARILGIDIDEHLVGVARKNIRHYVQDEKNYIGKYPVSVLPVTVNNSNNNILANQHDQPDEKKETNPADAPPAPSSSTSSVSQFAPTCFPKNVWFLRENYVLESDEYLDMVREEYDIILALSITKWVHLNWGDAGIKRFLKRTFLQLRPGGRLILEAQEFAKYYKRAKMTPAMFDTYKGIRFKPHQFREFLLASEVGFSECQELGIAEAVSKGFQRALLVFRKAPKSRGVGGNRGSSKRQQPKKQEQKEDEEKQKGENGEEMVAKKEEEEKKQKGENGEEMVAKKEEEEREEGRREEQ